MSTNVSAATANTTTLVDVAVAPPEPPKPKTRTKGTRYEIMRLHDPVIGEIQLWAAVAVVDARSARDAIKQWALGQQDMRSDALKVGVRAIPVSRITQVNVEVQQRSELSFS